MAPAWNLTLQSGLVSILSGGRVSLCVGKGLPCAFGGDIKVSVLFTLKVSLNKNIRNTLGRL